MKNGPSATVTFGETFLNQSKPLTTRRLSQLFKIDLFQEHDVVPVQGLDN